MADIAAVDTLRSIIGVRYLYELSSYNSTMKVNMTNYN